MIVPFILLSSHLDDGSLVQVDFDDVRFQKFPDTDDAEVVVEGEGHIAAPHVEHLTHTQENTLS